MEGKILALFVLFCGVCATQASPVDAPSWPQHRSSLEMEHSIPSMLQETGVFMEEDGSLVDAHHWLQNGTGAAEPMEFLELSAGVEKVHGYCEICVRMLQMYQRGLPDVCAGLTDTFFISVGGLVCFRRILVATRVIGVPCSASRIWSPF
jgi:hypothetical protein